jgi:queuosine precursor transporter
MGKEASIAWVALLALLANLFVTKQITLFGLNVTCSDSLAVGYLLGSNLIQEFFGKEAAKKSIWISFSLSVAFLLLSFVHLVYKPNIHDTTQTHFSFLLQPLLRLTLASFFAFLVTQFIDLQIFSYVKKKTEGRWMAGRIVLCTSFAHLIDTILFTFSGLYGIVASVFSVILFSFTIKLLVIALATPFLLFCRKVMRNHVSI